MMHGKANPCPVTVKITRPNEVRGNDGHDPDMPFGARATRVES